MAAPHDYVVYIFSRAAYPPGRPQLKTKTDSHAGESETAHTMISRPDLVHQERSGDESGADRNRLDLPASVYTGIWWYAKFPNHYAGDGTAANTALGEFDMKAWIAGVANTLRAVKADQAGPRLQNEFFEGQGSDQDTPVTVKYVFVRLTAALCGKLRSEGMTIDRRINSCSKAKSREANQVRAEAHERFNARREALQSMARTQRG
jgi:hypothetical protein